MVYHAVLGGNLISITRDLGEIQLAKNKTVIIVHSKHRFIISAMHSGPND